MPWRVWRVHRGDPNRSKHFIVLAVIAAVMFAGAVALLSSNVDRNSENIAKRPTKEQLLHLLQRVRADQRRACGVVNDRFRVLSEVIAGQRPSAQTTAYYRDHPAELRKAQAQFDQTLEALRPRNCQHDYPVPTIRDVIDETKGGGAEPNGKKPVTPP